MNIPEGAEVWVVVFGILLVAWMVAVVALPFYVASINTHTKQTARTLDKLLKEMKQR